MTYKDPPCYYLIDILENCPWAIFTFYLLWKNNAINGLKVDTKAVEKNYIISIGLFREYLFDLAKLNFIFFAESDASFDITILQPALKAEGKAIC